MPSNAGALSPPPSLETSIEASRAALGEGSASFHLDPPLAPAKPAFTAAHDKAAREQSTSSWDYFQAIQRQDSPVDGIMAWAVENRYTPDPAYDPYDERRLAELSAGIDPQFHPELLKATSAAHGLYIRDRLLQRQSDLTTLSDLGVPGTIGRLAAGFIDPANLALGYGAGVLTTVARGGATLSKARSLYTKAAATGDAAVAARGATMAEKVAKAETGVRGALTGLGGAAVGGYAFERARQAVNFEDSQFEAVIAGLVGTAFSAPFVYAGSRRMATIRAAAVEDLERFQVLKRVQEEGRAPTPEEHALFAYADARAPEQAPAKRGGKKDAEVEATYAARTEAIKAEVEKAYAARELALAAAREGAPAESPRLASRRAAAELAQAKKELTARIERAVRDVPPDSPMAAAFDRALSRRAAAEVAVTHAPVDPNAELRVLLRKSGAYDDAPPAPREDAPVQPEALSTPDVPRQPVDKPVSVVGRETSFDLHGDYVDGTIVGVREDGKLMIEVAETGKVRNVHPDDIEPGAPGHVAYTPEPGDGFVVPGSVGAAAEGSALRRAIEPIGDTGSAGMNKRLGTDAVGIPARFDISATLDRSPNQSVRGITQMLVKEAIQFSPVYAQGQSASEAKRQMQRVLGGEFHSTMSGAEAAAGKKAGWPLFSRAQVDRFRHDVSLLTAGDASVLQQPRNAAIRAELEQGAAAMRKVYDTALMEAKQAGVKGAADVVDLGDYVTRVWRPDLIHALEAKHGKDAIAQLIADSALSPQAHGDVAGAKRFLEAIKKLEYSNLSTDLVFTARDAGTLRRELGKANLSDAEIESLITTLFENHTTSGDSGNAPNLKFRFQLDESFSADIGGETLTVRSMMENDSRVLVDRYLNHMGGHIALAKRGVKSRADFEALLRDADMEHDAHDVDPKHGNYASERTLLVDLYDNITGRPMSNQHFGKFERIAAAVRGYTRALYLGQLGFTAATEMYHAASHATFQASLQQMPTLRKAWRAMKAGHVPEESLADDIRIIAGFGTEHQSSYARQHELTEFTYDRKLHDAENLANRASHAVDRLSGNNFITSFTRLMSGAFETQRYANLATGKKKLTAAERKRLVGSGINDADIDGFLKSLKEHVVMDDSGRVEHIRYEDWSVKDNENYARFRTALDRDVRTGIQDHDLGETWFFQHSTAGKIFTELRAFMLAAHSKQTMSSLYYRDARALHLWTTSLVTQSLAYMIQTATNFAHNPEELEKRLTAERVAKAAFARSNMAGLLPVVLNTFVAKPLGHDLSGGGLTANTENRDLFTTPSMMAVQRALSTLQASGQSLTAGENFTGKDVKNALGLIPGSNAFGARSLVDMVSNLAPKSELPQPKQ